MSLEYQVAYFLSFLSLLGIGIFALVMGKFSKKIIAFVLFTAGVLGWLITLYLFKIWPTENYLTFIGRVNFVSTIGLAIAWVGFAHNFVERHYSKNKQLLLYGLGVVLAAVTLFTPYITIEEKIISGQKVTTFGSLYFGYAAYFIGMVGYGFYVLAAHIKDPSTPVKIAEQLKTIVAGGTATAAIAITTNIVLPFGFDIFSLQQSGALSTLILIGSIAYAIFAKGLFDLRLVISRAIIYSGILGVILSVYGVTLFLISNFVDTGPSTTLITSAITAFVLSFSFEPIHSFLSERTDTWLYKKEYEQQEVTKVLSEKLVTALGLEEGLDVVMRTLTETLHLDKAVTYVFQQGDLGKETVKRIQQIGHNSKASLSLSDKDFLVSFFTTHNHILSTRELERELEEEARLISNDRISKSTFRLSSEYLRQHAIKQSVLHKLKELDTAIAIPLHLSM